MLQLTIADTSVTAHNVVVESSRLPAKAKSYVSSHSWHDHLMIWVLEHKSHRPVNVKTARAAFKQSTQDPQ